MKNKWRCVYSQAKNIRWDTHYHVEAYVNPLVSNQMVEDDGSDSIPKVVCVAKLVQAAKVHEAKKRVVVLNRAKGLVQYRASNAYKRFKERIKKQEEKLRERINRNFVR